MSERKVLGRGLSSLIPPAPVRSLGPEALSVQPLHAAGEVATRPLLLPTSEIRVNPRQPRRRFLETALEELAQSIREVGLLQPLIVRNTAGGYELVAGERRLRAAKKAGLSEVPVIVRSSSDLDQLEVALIENLQRQDLNPIEEAMGYQRLSSEFGLTQDAIAQKVGRERSTITNLLRLLKLSAVVQEAIALGAISMGHARALLPLEDHRRQETLARRVEKEGLSVRQVEHLVRGMVKNPSQKQRRIADEKTTDPNVRHLAEELQRALGARVEIHEKGEGGDIQIHYYTREEFRRLVDRLIQS